VRPRFLILAACLALGLAACSDDATDSAAKDEAKDSHESKDTSDAKEAKEKPVMPICPQVAIVAPLDTIRDFGEEAPDPSEFVAEAKLLNLEGTCAYEDEGIDVTFDLNMAAARGPRLGGLHTSFPFFAAVVDPNGTILNKEPMTADFGFSSDEKIARRQESLHIFIPLAKEQQTAGPDYRVLIGFQVPSDQLAIEEKQSAPAAKSN
jgi:hypothetical protein